MVKKIKFKRYEDSQSKEYSNLDLFLSLIRLIIIF